MISYTPRYHLPGFIMHIEHLTEEVNKVYMIHLDRVTRKIQNLYEPEYKQLNEQQLEVISNTALQLTGITFQLLSKVNMVDSSEENT